jgi:hypothetical protein
MKNQTESQNTQILNFLESGRSITQYESLVKFGCLRLASRINELRNKGYDIESKKVELSNGKYVSRYSIKK